MKDVAKMCIIRLNYGATVLEKNQDLKGYSYMVSRVRRWMAKGETLASAVQKAIKECLAKKYLEDFLRKHENEVYNMFDMVYDIEEAKRVAAEEAREDALEQGREEGLEQGREEGKQEIAKKMLHDNEPIDKITRYTSLTKEQILSLTA